MITQAQLAKFDREYFAGLHGNTRYGQAVLNAFHEDKDVAAHRSDSILWEAPNKGAAIQRMRELGIYPNT